MIGGKGMTFGQLVIWAIPQVMLIVGVWFAVRAYERRDKSGSDRLSLQARRSRR